MAANDVKWSHGSYDTTIATAAANGQIVIYDLNRPGVEFARLHEHVRQVHKVAFNPFKENLLLSGSQDATARLWDLGQLAGDRSVMTCRSQCQYPGNNEGIRDVKWSPTNENEFAVGTDNGVVQRWDTRNPKVPLTKVNAHEKTCHSIDWHPDGKHLVSGGADKYVNVWDFWSTDRRRKPCWQLRAPQAVLNVCWRPPSWNAEDANTGNWQCTQLATSYDSQDPRIHIWDFRRQFVPFREIDRYDRAPTAILWHSEGLLWSVGSAGIFTQTDIYFAPKVSDRRNHNLVAISPRGEIIFFSQEKARKRKSVQDAADEFLSRNSKTDGSREKLSGSQSVTEGSLEEASLLSSSFKSRHRKAHSTRSSKSLASTPPLAGIPPSAGPGEQTQKLDETMNKDLVFHHAQVASSGRILGLFEENAFKFLARFYRTPSLASALSLDLELHKVLCQTFQQNAFLAAQTNQHQLAQTWRIIGLAVEKELRSWSDHNIRSHALTPLLLDHNIRSSPRNLRNETNDIVPIDDRDLPASENEKVTARLKISLTLENSSNMTTPIARPVPDTSADSVAAVHGAISEENESLSLPGPQWGNRLSQNHPDRDPEFLNSKSAQPFREIVSPDNGELASNMQPYPETTPASSSSIGFPGLDHHMSERRSAMENYRAMPRPLLRLDEPAQLTRNPSIPLLDRHDSNESFQLFSASTDSSHRANSFGVSFGSSQESEQSPGQWDSLERRPVGDERSLQDVAGASRNVAIASAEPIATFSGGLSNKSARVLNPPPPLRPFNLPPPITHFNEMEHLKRSKTSTVESVQQANPEYERSRLLSLRQEPNYSTPWALISLLTPLITYHANDLSSSQLPAHLLLQLSPLLPSTIPADLILSILLSYHAQLTSLSLYSQAAQVRKLSHHVYADVSEYGSYGITPGGPWCTVCKKASKGNGASDCERCGYRWADCPICDGEGPLPTDTFSSNDGAPCIASKNLQASDSLWGWCQWCGHGGHAGCLRIWWNNAELSEGGCATAGCLHDCIAGTRREESVRRKGEAKKAGAVRGDDWVVDESRAVERVRGLVGVEEINPPGMKAQGQSRSKTLGAGQGPLSIGMLGRSSSGGKKVRLLVPQYSGEASIKVKGNGNGEAGKGASASMP